MDLTNLVIRPYSWICLPPRNKSQQWKTLAMYIDICLVLHFVLWAHSRILRALLYFIKMSPSHEGLCRSLRKKQQLIQLYNVGVFKSQMAAARSNKTSKSFLLHTYLQTITSSTNKLQTKQKQQDMDERKGNKILFVDIKKQLYMTWKQLNT